VTQKVRPAARGKRGGPANDETLPSGIVFAPNTPPAFSTQDQPLRAELIGDDRCSAAGLTAHHAAPALALCRLLIAAGFDADRALHAYRGPVLCLRIRTIGAGATLTVDESRSAFRRWKPSPYAHVSLRIAPRQRAAIPLHGAAP
jgi:hypothetical protein